MVEAKKVKNWILYSVFCLVAVLFFTAFVFIAFDVRGNRFWGLDKMCLEFALSIRTPWLNVIFTMITNLVNPIVLGIIGFCILLFSKKLKGYSFALFLNMGLVSLLNLALKYFFVRSRPDGALQLVVETGYSFPSGHAMLAVAFYGFLIYMLWHLNWKVSYKVGLTITGVCVILLISVSRVYLGVHYATDVIGGLCISITYLMVFLLVMSRARHVTQNVDSEYKKHTFLGGFKYAIRGIGVAIKEENNLLVQFAAGMLVVVFGVALRLTFVEWAVCIVVCFMVVALELVNTAIENLSDKVTMEYDERIKKTKDIAAGAVLTMSICAVIVACIIFLPKLPFLFK